MTRTTQTANQPMDPIVWRRVCDIFADTIARHGDERAAFLADACLGDDVILHAVEQLLSANEAAGDFLEVPAAVLFLATESKTSAARPGPESSDQRTAASAGDPPTGAHD